MKQSRISGMRKIGLVILLLSPVALGCSRAEQPGFRLNEVEIAARELGPKQQQVIADVLYALFGTPDKPFVMKETGLNVDKVQLASGAVWSDAGGRQRGLYRQHCGHCHGTTGDGMGPTAAILNPYPRDYRRGLFKFKSTERAAEPTDLDLERIIRQGAAGTAMPSFDLLAGDEVAALVEYVKYLSMRGQTEVELINRISDLGEDEQLALDYDNIVGEVLVNRVVKKWQAAGENVIQPPERSEQSAEELETSIAAGRELFYGAKANCVKCHGPSELGDGQTSDFDDWTKPLVDLAKQVNDARKSIPADPDLSSADRAKQLASVNAKAAALAHDSLPPREIIPRNLRLGIYRGGRRPLDLYRRLYSGINGAPMPGVGPASKGAVGPITPEEIWNLVDYVRSLPYESISKPQKQQKFTGREQL
jgi:mono/diheme cytochrome c family protein